MQDLPDIPQPRRHVMIRHMGKHNEGLRPVFLPSAAVQPEPTGSREHGAIALVLLAWIAGGLVVCARAFRWQPARSRSNQDPDSERRLVSPAPNTSLSEPAWADAVHRPRSGRGG